MAKTGAQHLKSLQDGREVYLNGKKVDDVTTHPAYKNAVAAAASLYDFQAHPDNIDWMTFESPTSGERVNRCWQLTTTYQELVDRRRAIEGWSRLSGGWLGRSPDHIASSMVGQVMGLPVFEKHSKERAGALMDYFRFARDSDAYMTYVIINPQADRNKSTGEQQDEFLATGVVDGCFSDSSEVGSHNTGRALNRTYNLSFEAGKVTTMAEATKRFGGAAGKPYPQNATGTLVGKFPDQQGVNAIQIEMFNSSEKELLVLMAGVAKGYLVQAHVSVNNLPVTNHGCPEMLDTAATFLIGAGENSYFGSGSWIAADLADVQSRWCPELFERPLGMPKADAVKGSDGVWRREFASGTKVTFDGNTGKGAIVWGK